MVGANKNARPKDIFFETSVYFTTQPAVPLKLQRFAAPLRLQQALCIHAAITGRFYLLSLSSFQLRSYKRLSPYLMACTNRHFSEERNINALFIIAFKIQL